jgi:hypothetical protein
VDKAVKAASAERGMVAGKFEDGFGFTLRAVHVSVSVDQISG